MPTSTHSVAQLQSFSAVQVQPLLGREVRLEVFAPPQSFSPVGCPTRQGFKPYSGAAIIGTMPGRG